MARTENQAVRRGNRLGFWIFRTAARLLGLRGAYGLLYFVCLYYLAFDRRAVNGAMPYVRRRFRGSGALRRSWEVYRIFISQGKSLIDRYAILAGSRSFPVDIEGYDGLKKTLKNSPKGVILLSAHVGNWQASMTALARFGRTVHLLMRPEDNEAVRAALGIDREQDQGRVRIITTDGGLGGVLEAVAALNAGDLVSIMGDRAFGARTMEAELFGDRCRLPFGAFSIAAAAQCPVVVLLSAKVAPDRYMVDVSRMIEPPAGAGTQKKAAIAACVQAYAAALEDFAQRYPDQWFVFADLWEGSRERHTSTPEDREKPGGRRIHPH